MKEMEEKYEKELLKMKNEKENLLEKIENAENELKNIINEYQNKLMDMKKEIDSLNEELNKKEKEYQDLLEEKMKLQSEKEAALKFHENQYEELNNNIENLNKENEDLKKQLAEIAELTGDKFKLLNDQILKSTEKLNSLMDVYNAHIQFLKERFDNLLNDLNILFNLQKNNPKELNEKFSVLIKSIQKSIDLINKVSEREALIDNFKKELKGMKNKVDKFKGKIKNLEEENHELNDTLNVRKLQMKIKKLNISPTENAYFRLTQLMKNYATITELNLENNNLKSENDNQKAQIKLLNDSISTLKEKLNQNENTIKGLNNILEVQTKEYNDSNKQHKNEMKNLIDEVKRIKSSWTPFDKKMEYVNNI